MKSLKFYCIRLQCGDLNLPDDAFLPESENKLPHFFFADAAFPLDKHIMKPYPNDKLDHEKRIFNYRWQKYLTSFIILNLL